MCRGEGGECKRCDGTGQIEIIKRELKPHERRRE